MPTRRTFLTATAGAATAVGLSGCLSAFEDGNSDEGENDDQLPGEGPDVDDDLLTALADPSSQVPPRYFAGYRYDIADLREYTDPIETLPSISGRVSAGALAETIEGSIDGLSLAEFDTFTGSTYRSSGIVGEIGFPAPSGEAIHATGSFDADPIVSFFEGSDTFESLGSADGYERYLNERENVDRYTAFGVDDGVFVVIARSDVDADPEAALTLEFDQREREDAPIVRSAPAFANAIQDLEGESIRAGAKYALVALGADTGTAAFDDVVYGLTGAGVGATLGEETALQRSVGYLTEEMGAESTVSAAYQASESDGVPAEAWSFSKSDSTIFSETTVAEVPSASILQVGLPIPAYGSVFQQINPADLGRDAPPRVFFQPELNDGTLVISHVGGEAVENLRVRYVHDGEVREEDWSGPVTQGDQFTSEATIDSETQSWIVWEPETVNAAVLSRFET